MIAVSHDPACTLTAREYKGPLPEADLSTVVAHSLRADGFDASEDGTGRGTPLVATFDPRNVTSKANRTRVEFGEPANTLSSPGLKVGTGLDMGWAPAIAFSCKDHGADAGAIAPTLRSMGHDNSHANAGGQVAVAFDITGSDPTVRSGGAETDVHTSRRARPPGGSEGSTTTVVAQPYTLAIRGRDDGHNLEYRQDGTANAVLTPNGGRGGIGVGAIAQTWAVRRLTPTECERLQGFPDEYTNVPWRGKNGAPDGPRYKALGNSMACNCMRWIGMRIQLVSDIAEEAA